MGDSISTPQNEASTELDGGDSDQGGRKRRASMDTSHLPKELTSKYEVIEKIGSGSFGSVYRVKNSKTGGIFAAKYADTRETASEVEIQAKIDDIHVVKIFETIPIPAAKRMVIVMEYCDGGNLLQWVERNRRHELLNERLIMQMFREICNAVYNCHQLRIIHRDLKPENILLDNRRRVKLADFGVARILNRKSVAKSFCGTPPYMAPELFLSYLSKGTQGYSEPTVGYDAKCDVWSIGCILWDMANNTGQFIFQLAQNPGLNVAQANTGSIGAKEVHELIEKCVPASFGLSRRFLNRMLVKDPERRISLGEILQDRELREFLENPLTSHWSDAL